VAGRTAKAYCLSQFTVRGRQKVTTVLNWFGLSNNILAGHRLLGLAA
jgi:hypothetical protein